MTFKIAIMLIMLIILLLYFLSVMLYHVDDKLNKIKNILFQINYVIGDEICIHFNKEQDDQKEKIDNDI